MAVAKKSPSTMSRWRRGFRQHRFSGAERKRAHLSATGQRVNEAVEQLGFVRNRQASALRGGQSG
jgi:DNA-binding LacI/PurR family transcriptional regulator